jgi:hypothetical protein
MAAVYERWSRGRARGRVRRAAGMKKPEGTVGAILGPGRQGLDVITAWCRVRIGGHYARALRLWRRDRRLLEDHSPCRLTVPTAPSGKTNHMSGRMAPQRPYPRTAPRPIRFRPRIVRECGRNVDNIADNSVRLFRGVASMPMSGPGAQPFEPTETKRYGRLASAFWVATAVALCPWLWAIITLATPGLVAALVFAATLYAHPTDRRVLVASAAAGVVTALGALLVPLTSPYGYAVQLLNVLVALAAGAAAAYSCIGLRSDR